MEKSKIIVIFNWGLIEPSIVGYAKDRDDAIRIAKVVTGERDYRPNIDQVIVANIETSEADTLSNSELGYREDF